MITILTKIFLLCYLGQVPDSLTEVPLSDNIAYSITNETPSANPQRGRYLQELSNCYIKTKACGYRGERYGDMYVLH